MPIYSNESEWKKLVRTSLRPMTPTSLLRGPMESRFSKLMALTRMQFTPSSRKTSLTWLKIPLTFPRENSSRREN